ncbi:MAG: hypothetical protein ABI778_01185 [Ignavibacteriota bacterium]
MKRNSVPLLIIFCSIGIPTTGIFSQAIIHEKPVIADEVPNVPEELFEAGKLSKFVTLSVPEDERWNPDGVNLNANGAVFAIAQDEFTRCFIGGHFDSIGGVQAKGIASYTDYLKTFSAIGGGVNGDVYAISIVSSDELYIGGNFTKAGNINAKNIAHWTGDRWEALGSGTDSTVLAIGFVGGILYVGGNFRTAGGKSANYIAKFDTLSKSWSPILDGTFNGVDGGVAAITLVLSGDVLVGGGFTKAGSVVANKIASLSNGKWYDLKGGVGGPNSLVSVITSRGLIGGSFNSAGGLSKSNIASWKGNNWSDLSEFPWGFDGPVYSIADPGPLFVGGEFHKSGLLSCDNIAKGNYSLDPLAMGSGLDGPCYALAGEFLVLSLQGEFRDHLHVGGEFSKAGMKTSQNFAIWGESVGSGVRENKLFAHQISLNILPNPIQNLGQIYFNLPQHSAVALSIFDALGRRIKSLACGIFEAGAQKLDLNCKDFPSGAYSCLIQIDDQFATSSFVVAR